MYDSGQYPVSDSTIWRSVKRAGISLLSLPPLFDALNRAYNTTPTIFTLHRRMRTELGIGGHDPRILKAQLEFLSRRGYRVVPLDDIEAWIRGAETDMTNTVAFTFDDGYQDQAELIRDVFVPAGMPVNMFLITDFIDGRSWPWDARIQWLINHAPAGKASVGAASVDIDIRIPENRVHRRRVAGELIRQIRHLPPLELERTIAELAGTLALEVPRTPPASHAPITWDEARQLESWGVRFGSHSRSHYILSTLTNAEAEEQIHGSFARLTQELTSPLKIFCYPIGNRSDYSGRELSLLRQAGYTSALTMRPGAVERPAPSAGYDAFSIKRYSMPNSIEDFVSYTSWIERIKNWARARNPDRYLRDRFGSPRGLLRLVNASLDYRLGRLNTPSTIDWSRVRRLVFVCHGNVCRSPFAEAIALAHGLPAISLGLKTDQGTRVNAIASRIALTMGIDMTRHESRSVEHGIIQEGDLLLGMEPAHLRALRGIKLTENVQISLIGLFGSPTGKPYLQDPYGLSDTYHRNCLRTIRDSVDDLANQWKRHRQEATSEMESA